MFENIPLAFDGSHSSEAIIPIVRGKASELDAANVLLSVLSKESIAVISRECQRQR